MDGTLARALTLTLTLTQEECPSSLGQLAPWMVRTSEVDLPYPADSSSLEQRGGGGASLSTSLILAAAVSRPRSAWRSGWR